MSQAKSQNPTACQIKITLTRLQPPIWRRVLVPSAATLGDLHGVIQSSMGWHDCHLHCFTVGMIEFSRSWEDLKLEQGQKNELDTRVISVLRREGDSVTYTYDYGDDWVHKVTLEKMLPITAGQRLPICLAGRRACPPENCGGPWSYSRMVEVRSGSRRKDDEEYQLDNAFDPARFDLDEVNARMTHWSPNRT